MKRITLKEKLQVADLLAIRDGYERRQEKHINEVAGMSDNEIIKILENETGDPSTVARLNPSDVDIINPETGAGGDLFAVASSVIDSYLNKHNWDAEKISPLQWGAVCLACGRSFRSFFRCEQKNGPIKGNYNYINVDRVADALPVWLELCITYNKVPLICNFCDFCGVSEEWLYKFGSGVTSDGVDLVQKLHKIQENGLNQRILNPKENPVGAIFLQKAINGYSETKIVKYETSNGSTGAGSLPDFGNYKQIDAETEKNAEK